MMASTTEPTEPEQLNLDTTHEIEISLKAPRYRYVSRHATVRSDQVENEISERCATELGFDSASPTLETRWRKRAGRPSKLDVFRIVRQVDGPNEISLSESAYDHIHKGNIGPKSYPIRSTRKKNKRERP